MPSLAAAAAALAASAAGDGVDIVSAAKAAAAEYRVDYQDLIEIAYEGGLVNGELPDAVQQRTSLLALGLQRAGMSSMPNTDCLRSLVTLDVSCNYLASLPNCISNLQRLKVLDCSDNRLHELPASLFAVTTLEQLIAYKNNIKRLDEGVYQLKQLIEMNLYNNNLNFMPATLYLPNLEQLNVAANHLRTVSDVSGCVRLVRFAAYWNRIGCCPMKQAIHNLQSLELQRNVLHLNLVLPKTPQSAMEFSSLTKLSLSNNALRQLQADLLPPNLEEILLRSCGMSAIIRDAKLNFERPILPRLRTLNLSQNFLKEIPSFMLPVCLVTLDVSHNLINRLPDCLTSMSGLWNLFVSDNKIGELPDWTINLGDLRRFSCFGNPILPTTQQRQLASNIQMAINLRELARKDALRAAAAEEAALKQMDERLRLQETLKCERTRLTELVHQAQNVREQVANKAEEAEKDGKVVFSIIGRSKLLNIDGALQMCIAIIDCYHDQLIEFLSSPQKFQCILVLSFLSHLGSRVGCRGCGGWVRVSHPTPPGTKSQFTFLLEKSCKISPLVGAVHEDFSDWEGEKWPHRNAWFLTFNQIVSNGNIIGDPSPNPFFCFITAFINGRCVAEIHDLPYDGDMWGAICLRSNRQQVYCNIDLAGGVADASINRCSNPKVPIVSATATDNDGYMRLTSQACRMWLQRISQHSSIRQKMQLTSDTLAPNLLDSPMSPSRVIFSQQLYRRPHCDDKDLVFDQIQSKFSPYFGSDKCPIATNIPATLSLLAAALSHNNCDAAVAFQAIVGSDNSMNFSMFTAVVTHLLSQQEFKIQESDIEECFDFISKGHAVIQKREWISALESSETKTKAEAVVHDMDRRHVRNAVKTEFLHNRQHQQALNSEQQQDILCIPNQEYWMVKGGQEVRAFEWYFIERRRWADPVDVWLRAQEVFGTEETVGRVLVIPMSQTTKGIMRLWHKLKQSNDDDSGDIGYEQLKLLLKICRIRATEAELQRMFNEADEDGSGSIDSVEFLSIVKNLQAAGGSTGVDASHFVSAFIGPSEAMQVVLACTHMKVLEAAGSSGRKENMFHIKLHDNEARVCELAAQKAIDFVCDNVQTAHQWVSGLNSVANGTYMRRQGLRYQLTDLVSQLPSQEPRPYEILMKSKEGFDDTVDGCEDSRHQIPFNTNKERSNVAHLRPSEDEIELYGVVGINKKRYTSDQAKTAADNYDLNDV